MPLTMGFGKQHFLSRGGKYFGEIPFSGQAARR